MDGPTHLVVGLLKKPHGIQGDALVYPVTDEPDAIFEVGKRLLLMDREGHATRELVIERSRQYHRAWLLHFEGIETREALALFRERHLAIPLSEARALEDGEYYMHELVGLDVATAAGAGVGRVADVIEAPQGWILEVEGEGKRHLIPFTSGVVQRVDRAERRMVITPPAGLLEL